MRVLIVEDEPLIVMDLEYMVTQWGYEVCGTASDADDAVEKALLHRPHVVLMDVLLGNGTNGIDAARRIRDALDVPCIFLTGKDDRATVEASNDLGTIACIAKPIPTDELRRALARAREQSVVDRP